MFIYEGVEQYLPFFASNRKLKKIPNEEKKLNENRFRNDGENIN